MNIMRKNKRNSSPKPVAKYSGTEEYEVIAFTARFARFLSDHFEVPISRSATSK